MTALGGLCIEPGPVVAHGEQQATGLLPQADLDPRVGGVLGSVLQRLEAAEIESRLRLGGIPTDAVGDDVHRKGVAVGCRTERFHEPAIHQQRRVDPVRQLPQLLNGLLDLGCELVQHLHTGFLVVDNDVLGQPEVHGQRDEVLLRSVVKIAFDPTTLGVTARDDPGP